MDRRPNPRHARSSLKGALVAFVASALCACQRAPDATPEGALDLFLRACHDAPHDPDAAAHAYALLAPAARRVLEDRARRATGITGKPVTPEQMLVPAWSPLRFDVAKMDTVFAGDKAHAFVDVRGPDPATQQARVPMELEGPGWRVAIAIP